jgi:hypothetical protein
MTDVHNRLVGQHVLVRIVIELDAWEPPTGTAWTDSSEHITFGRWLELMQVLAELLRQTRG